MLLITCIPKFFHEPYFPCILPLLPIIVGGSVSGGRSLKRAFTVVAALGFSVLAFTLVLKVSTAFIAVPPVFWQWLSGGLLVLFGLVTAFPVLWEKLPFTAAINRNANKTMSKGYQKQSFWGDILVGVALGPVFTSCSPTYFIVLATILPADPVAGVIYLVSYTLGLSIALLGIALVGQKIVDKLGLASDSHGWFKRAIGVLFIVVGLLVFFGIDKQIAASLPAGAYGITSIEQKVLEFADGTTASSAANNASADQNAPITMLSPEEKAKMYTKAPELVAPNAYLNTAGAPISIGEFKGKKVVLIDFWTYSCINCQRTTPYLNSWYDKYEKDGLVIIGVHTPEFAFEKVTQNVQDALAKEGIKYPVVLDNEYQTWNAFGNQDWPRKYLIDIDGFIVYDYAGEGAYDKTEAAIQRALKERAARLNDGTVVSGGTVDVAPVAIEARSGETYFGWSRNEFLANGAPHQAGTQSFTAPALPGANRLYLDGSWTFEKEYASAGSGAGIIYNYSAKGVYFVASSDAGADIEVLRDGVPVSAGRGADVNASAVVHIQESRLYKLIDDAAAGTHVLEIRVKKGTLNAFTFTFG